VATTRGLTPCPSFVGSSRGASFVAPPPFRAPSPSPAQAQAQAAAQATPGRPNPAYCMTPNVLPPPRVMAVPSSQCPSHIPGRGGGPSPSPSPARPPQTAVSVALPPPGMAPPLPGMAPYERPSGLPHSLSWVPPPVPAAPGQTRSSWPQPPDMGMAAVDSALTSLHSVLYQQAPPAEAGVASSRSVPCLPQEASFVDINAGPPALRFLSAAASRQHPAKINTGIVNADAVEEGAAHLGICDGVSGVHHLGIPPDELPRDLLRSCRERLQARSSEEADRSQARVEFVDDGTWLTGIIEEAYDSTEAFGATTLLLAALRGSDLVTACLGDCALLVLRPSSFNPLRLRPIFKTEPGRYDSRRPVQVQRLHGFSDAHAHVVIQGAMVSTTPVQPGDVLVLGSDGLFDNVRDDDIRRTVEQCCSPNAFMAPGQQPQAFSGHAQLKHAAATLVDLAISRVKLDQPEGAPQPSPWNPNGDVPGNNADDTTALVAVVAQEDFLRARMCQGAFADDGGFSQDSTILSGRQSGRQKGADRRQRMGHACETRKEDCVLS